MTRTRRWKVSCGLPQSPSRTSAGAVVFLGLVYLGATLREGYGGGPALTRAVAMVAAGAILTGFAVIYGFSGF